MSARALARGTALAVAAAALEACAPSAPPAAPSSSFALAQPVPGPYDLAPRLVSEPDSDPRPPALRLLEQTRFDLDVQDAELRPLLVGLIRHSPLNAVVSPAVSGSVTADLENVSLHELLEQIVVPRGFSYQVRGNTLVVEPSPLETRTYAIEYPSYSRTGSSDLAVYGALGTSHEIGSAGSGGSKDTSTSSVKTTQQLDFWKELEASLRALIFPGNAEAAASSERQVMVASHSGMVLVRAERSVQDQARALLEEMASSNQRQVLIDARILEVTLSDDLDLGVDLEYAPNLPNEVRGITRRLIDPLAGAAAQRSATALTNLSPSLNTGGFTFGIASERLSAQLRALAAQTDVRVVSTPRVATLNNHQALIKVVRNQVFFIAQVEPTLVEGVGTVSTTEFVPQIVPIGVTLDVTPRISDGGDITLHIHPSVSEVVSVQAQPVADPNAVGIGSLPVIDLRETDTVLRVADGQTIVMGGLIRSRELDMERKTPFLGDIPLLGALFRGTNVEELRTELVILLTPRVLDPPRISELASASLDSLERLDQQRLERRPQRQWWRKPMRRSYGVP